MKRPRMQRSLSCLSLAYSLKSKYLKVTEALQEMIESSGALVNV